MSKAFDSIAIGLKQAIAYAEGKPVAARSFRPDDIDVAHLRKQLNMTQSEFAYTFCISLATLRHWERGDRKPQGPALTLLHVVSKEPKAVLRALQ